MAGAVDGEGGFELLVGGDLGGGVHPVVPRRVSAGHLDAGLLEQRLVGEAAHEGELRHEARDDVGPVGAHPVELGAEILAPVVRVLEVGGEVEPVVGLLLDVGDAGDVGPFAGLELDRKLLLDHLVRHVVERDVDVRVLLHEAVQKVLDHLTLDTVGIPHHPHVARESCGGQECCGECRENCSFHWSSPPVLVCFQTLWVCFSKRGGFRAPFFRPAPSRWTGRWCGLPPRPCRRCGTRRRRRRDR